MVSMFLFLMILSFGVLMAGTRRATSGNRLGQRLQLLSGEGESLKAGEEDADLAGMERPTLSVRLDMIVARYAFAKKLIRLILQSGSERTLGDFLVLTVAIASGTGVAAFLLLQKLPVAFAALCAGGALPWMILRVRRTRRVRKFAASIPEAMDLMARSLRAGHAVGASIEMIAEQASEPLAGEFRRVFHQQRLGLRFRDALLEMVDRVPSPDLHFLVTAILVQRDTGGDLTEILDRTTHVIRERVRIEGEVRVYTAQGRLTGWILSLLPIILLLVINILSPGYSRMLFEDPTGQKLLYGGAVCILLGGLVISRIVDVKA
jgi:tight adherence protein B